MCKQVRSLKTTYYLTLRREVLFVGYLPFISVMSALDVSLVPRVSLRLGFRSRPICICNDMSDQQTHQDKLVRRLHISYSLFQVPR